jgi:hypothetical protein
MFKPRVGFYILICVLALSGIFLAYYPALSGALYYDDFANLEALENIDTTQDALKFLENGKAGPLGRPIALASFLIHAQGWPENSWYVLLTNVIIHLINAASLTFLSYLILKCKMKEGGADFLGSKERNFWIAIGAGLLWALMPIIASTSLIAIQRMTSLAALFGILGLVGFVYGYRYDQAPFKVFTIQAIFLGVGTLLSLFSKENGILFPVFALVIDFFVKGGRFNCLKVHEKIRRLILLTPLAFIFLYLSPLRADWFSIVDIRGFSIWERFETQLVVLWDYVRYAIAPIPSQLGPFHDDWRIVDNNTKIFAAAISWLFVVAICSYLSLKKITVWPLFALAWFFTSHLIESSFIALEIYFEHRNYLSFYGLCLALSFGAAYVTGNLKRVIPVIFSIYVIFQGLTLYSLSNFWGQPLVAAETWSEAHPASSRAAIHQAFLQVGQADDSVADRNYEYIRRERKTFALERLDRTISACPECMSVQLEALRYSCTLTSEKDTAARVENIIKHAPDGYRARSSIEILFRLRDALNRGECSAVSHDDLLTILDGLGESKYFNAVHYKARLLFLSAATAEDKGDTEARDEFLIKAEKIEPLAYPVLQYQVSAALKEGDYERAREAVRRRISLNTVFDGAVTEERLKMLMKSIDNAEKGDRSKDLT